MEKKPDSEESSILRQFGMFAIVLSSFSGLSGAGVGLGWLLWKKAGFPWWVILVTSLLGLCAACLQVVRFQRVLQNREKE